MSSSEGFHSDSSSTEEFYQEVYNELRQLAHAKMSKEYVYSTLQGTALVHEAWLRLGGEEQPRWQNRAHFFGAAAEAMRRILVDRARKRMREKNGGHLKRVEPESLNRISEEFSVDERLLRVSEALEKLRKVDERKADLVKLRYFFGMSFEKAADAMGISESTAKRWWVFARAWLQREITSN